MRQVIILFPIKLIAPSSKDVKVRSFILYIPACCVRILVETLAGPKSKVVAHLLTIWSASVECALKIILLTDSPIASLLDSLHAPP